MRPALHKQPLKFELIPSPVPQILSFCDSSQIVFKKNHIKRMKGLQKKKRGSFCSECHYIYSDVIVHDY